MRHGTGANLSRLDLLPEVTHRDVAPEVSSEIDEDRVDTRHRLKESGEIVVVGDLRRVLLTL